MKEEENDTRVVMECPPDQSLTASVNVAVPSTVSPDQVSHKPVLPHPSVYIIEEMEARGWSRDELATRLTVASAAHFWGITRLAIDMYFEVGPTDSRLLIGEFAEAYARVFGVSSEFFTNLETSWRASFLSAPRSAPATALKDLVEAIERWDGDLPSHELSDARIQLDAAVDAAKEALNVSHRVLARAGHTRSSGDESRAQNVAAPATAEEQK